MGQEAKKITHHQDKEILAEAHQLVEVYADRVAQREQASVSRVPKRISMTRFPERLKQVSHRGMSWTIIALLGFAFGVTLMVLILA